MGPGSCAASERGPINHEQVIGFPILMVNTVSPKFSRVARGSSRLRFAREQLKGPPPGPSGLLGVAGVSGARTSAGCRQPAHPLRSGSQICKEIWSSRKDQYCILNITIPFIETML